jgi:hypothetical protein
MTYAQWRQEQIAKGEFASFDWYKQEFPEVKEYVCVYLDPNCKLNHEEDAEILFATDNLGEACTFVYNKFKQEKRDIAVWQERSQGYREVYKADAKPRDAKGRYTKI